MVVISHLALIPLIGIRPVVTDRLADCPVTPDLGLRIGFIFLTVGTAIVCPHSRAILTAGIGNDMVAECLARTNGAYTFNSTDR